MYLDVRFELIDFVMDIRQAEFTFNSLFYNIFIPRGMNVSFINEDVVNLI